MLAADGDGGVVVEVVYGRLTSSRFKILEIQRLCLPLGLCFGKHNANF